MSFILNDMYDYIDMLKILNNHFLSYVILYFKYSNTLVSLFRNSSGKAQENLLSALSELWDINGKVSMNFRGADLEFNLV